jgi:serine/threonine-protein kinase
MAQLSSSSPLVGERYQVERFLGAGGMQNVYLALDNLFQRKVALKVPKDGATIARFQNSAVVSARMNHANIAKTLDYVEDSTGSYLIEELVIGCDLSQLVPSPLPYLPPSACAKIFHQLAKGLSASHRAGVVHRDLKPSNIMVVGGIALESVKITDFGIAKMAEAEIGQIADIAKGGSTSSKTVLGAIPYMAPESITDFKNASFASDVWAIAAITYELLTGKKPYGGGLVSIAAILQAAPLPKPSIISAPQFRGLGEELFAIIQTCLFKDSSQRPNAEILVKNIEQLCYRISVYELGTVSGFHPRFGKVGFLAPDNGKGVMYHKDSFYGASDVAIGDRVWFSRDDGVGNDRAMPLVKLTGKG